jgi:hypothetical protein
VDLRDVHELVGDLIQHVPSVLFSTTGPILSGLFSRGAIVGFMSLKVILSSFSLDGGTTMGAR